MSPHFEAVFCEHVVYSFEKQLALADVIGERAWHFNMDSGQLSFAKQGFLGKPLVFQVELLGTVSLLSNTWLWSWANEASHVPPALTESARILSGMDGVPEWAHPTFDVHPDDSDDHRIALAASGVLETSAYYRGPYDGGAAYFLLRDPRIQTAPPSILKLLTLFPNVISSVDVPNHRAAFLAYCRQRGFTVQEAADQVHVSLDGQFATGNFDPLDRLVELSGKVGG